LQQKNPSAKLPEITKQISQLWKSMPEKEKAERTEAARVRIEEYKHAKELADQVKVGGIQYCINYIWPLVRHLPSGLVGGSTRHEIVALGFSLCLKHSWASAEACSS